MNDLESRLVALLNRKAEQADVDPIDGFAEAPATVEVASVIELDEFTRKRRIWVSLAAAAAIIAVVAVAAFVGKSTDRPVTTKPDGTAGQTLPAPAVPTTTTVANSTTASLPGAELPLRQISAADSWGKWAGKFTNDGSSQFVHRVRAFEVGGLQWMVLDFAEVWIGGISQGSMLLSPDGGVSAAATNPVCCMFRNEVKWTHFVDLPPTVAYVTFNGGQSQRPVDGVAIVPSETVRLHDASGKPSEVQQPPQPDQIAVSSTPSSQQTNSLTEVFGSSMSKCLADEDFDMYATDAGSNATWTGCIAQAVAAWNGNDSPSTESSSAP